MITRSGNAGDFYSVVPMMQQHRRRQEAFDAALYAPHPEAERRFLRWIGTVAEDPRSTLVVAEDDGRIVGFLYATIEKELPIYEQEEFALVREWWVEEAFRGRGAGEAMIERAAAEFALTGVRQLRVRLAGGDTEARAVLEGCGFRIGACELVKELETPDR